MAGLDVVERWQHSLCIPFARNLGRLALGVGGAAGAVGVGRAGAGAAGVGVGIHIDSGVGASRETDVARSRARGRARRCGSALTPLRAGSAGMVIICFVITERRELEQVKHGATCTAGLFPSLLLGRLCSSSGSSGFKALLFLFQLFWGSVVR